ncbi:MAG: TlpA disulfide reductase family protein [Lutibacter sp.]|nr:TlpA disulfide reductase family protein [Lutibacter sp.]
MKRLFLTTTILLLLSSCQKETQKQTFYKTSDTGKVLTLTEFDNFKNELLMKLTKFKQDSESIALNETLIDSVVLNDSIIKTYKIDIKIEISDKETKIEKEEIYNYLNKELPSQILYTIDNKEISLKDFKGKPTALNFWFITCKPCIDEMPVLNQIMKKYSDKVNFISITFENKENVKLFLNTHQFDYLTIVGAEGFIDQLGIQAFPKNIFIDKNGIVRKIRDGIPYTSENGKMIMGNGDEFEKFIKELL